MRSMRPNSQMPEYIGIDYGRGQSNVDKATGIRFGVIAQNSCQPEAVDEIVTDGTDVAFAEAKKAFLEAVTERVDYWFNEHAFLNLDEEKQRAKFQEIIREGLNSQYSHSLAARVAEETAENWGKTSTRDEIVGEAEGAVDNRFGDYYESDGGLNDYLYERHGYKLTGCLQSDLFVLRSEFYTYAQFCSPCVPGAGNLDHPVDPEAGAPRSYCLGHDWFEDSKAPYRLWRVSDNVEILSKVGEVKCEQCQGTGRDALARVAKVRSCEIADIDTSVFDGLDLERGTFTCIRCLGTGKEKQTIEREGDVDPNFIAKHDHQGTADSELRPTSGD